MHVCIPMHRSSGGHTVPGKVPGKALRYRARPCGTLQGLADGSPAAGDLPCGRRRPRSCPLCNTRGRCEGGLFISAVCGTCRPRPLTQLRRVAGVSMAHSTAWCSVARGSRVLHRGTPAPRRRSLSRSRRRQCVCLRQINGSRGHPLPQLRRAVAHSGG